MDKFKRLMPNENDSKFDCLLRNACGGDLQALHFMRLWITYCHVFDDIVDGDIPFCAESLCRCNNVLHRILTNKFFVDNREALGVQMLLCSEEYVASEQLKNHLKKEGRVLAEQLRHSGMQLIRATALICGGEDLLANISRDLREYMIQSGELDYGQREEKS